MQKVGKRHLPGMMKILTIAFLLLYTTESFAQDNIPGRYHNYFGCRLHLNPDSTFKYTWHLDTQSGWTKGTWSQKKDTIYFRMVPTYDTVRLTKPGERIVDSLLISSDEISERLTMAGFSDTVLWSGGQNRSGYPTKLVWKKGRLYNIQNGRLVTKRQKGFWTKKKWIPWYVKSDE